jgi:indolepyruvate ferredoxin oxidoreductase alpha subunit
MVTKSIIGEEALALGAMMAGVRFVTGYPGTPSKGIFKALQEFSPTLPHPVYFHWATNEKVALELAVGATLAGMPSLVCVKSVGANVLLDALMTVNLTGVPSPLVIALGDDPSAWVSQNEQDSRWLALMSELPLLEPTRIEDAAEIMHAAFQLSAKLNLPVIVRFTRSFALTRKEILKASLQPVTFNHSNSLPSIASGGNAITLHARLQERLKFAEQWTNDFKFNRKKGDSAIVVMAVGPCVEKVGEVLNLLSRQSQRFDAAFLELATSFPLPRRWLLDNLAGKTVALVIEEGMPFVEMQLKALLQEARQPIAVRGKLTGDLPSVGELTLRQIGKALRNFLPMPSEIVNQLPDPQRQQGFTLKFCDGCPYPPFLDQLIRTAQGMGVKLVVSANPGCAIVAIGEPYQLVQIKHSMGGSVNLVASIAKFEHAPNRRYIALVGDSDFFHSAFNGIVNAVWWKAPMGLVILDNGGAAFTGGQPHPGSGFNASNEFTRPIQIERLLSALDIPVQVVSSRDNENLSAAIKWLLDYGDEIRALILREPCPFVPVWTQEGLKPLKTGGKIVGE